MGIEAGFEAAVEQVSKLTAEVQRLEEALQDKTEEHLADVEWLKGSVQHRDDLLAAHRKFEKRLRSYLAGGTDCYPSDLEAMMADELPKEAP